MADGHAPLTGWKYGQALISLITSMKNLAFMIRNKEVPGRPNVKKEIARLGHDPMAAFLEKIEDENYEILSNEISRYRKAYENYYLSQVRYLKAMSISARNALGPRSSRRHQKRKYSAYDRMIAAKYKQVAPYLSLDIENCVVHARIMLDRVTSVTRHFLKGANVPSFASFAKHKKFFQNLNEQYTGHEPYAKYIREQTDWFSSLLKRVRDDFIVHNAPKHLSFLGYSSPYQLEWLIHVPNGGNAHEPLEKMEVIVVNPLGMSYEVQQFLSWLCAYGLAHVERNAISKGCKG